MLHVRAAMYSLPLSDRGKIQIRTVIMGFFLLVGPEVLMTRKRLCPFYLRYRDRKNGILLEQAAKRGLSRDKPCLGLTTNKAWRIGPLC